jgi:hypothetical protein
LLRIVPGLQEVRGIPSGMLGMQANGTAVVEWPMPTLDSLQIRFAAPNTERFVTEARRALRPKVDRALALDANNVDALRLRLLMGMTTAGRLRARLALTNANLKVMQSGPTLIAIGRRLTELCPGEASDALLLMSEITSMEDSLVASGWATVVEDYASVELFVDRWDNWRTLRQLLATVERAGEDWCTAAASQLKHGHLVCGYLGLWLQKAKSQISSDPALQDASATSEGALALLAADSESSAVAEVGQAARLSFAAAVRYIQLSREKGNRSTGFLAAAGVSNNWDASLARMLFLSGDVDGAKKQALSRLERARDSAQWEGAVNVKFFSAEFDAWLDWVECLACTGNAGAASVEFAKLKTSAAASSSTRGLTETQQAAVKRVEALIASMRR